MKMTYTEIENWCKEHVMMHSKLLINRDGYSKYRYENGDTYEWHSYDEGQYDHVKIYINGELVSNRLYHDTWLDNGNFGKKLIAELPV